MPKYEIHYAFDGSGIIEIQADNQEQAEEIFMSGEYDNTQEIDTSENHFIVETYKLCDICQTPEDDDGRCSCTNKN